MTIDLEKSLFTVIGDGKTFEVQCEALLAMPNLVIYVDFASNIRAEGSAFKEEGKFEIL